jgi:hypothetical protein
VHFGQLAVEYPSRDASGHSRAGSKDRCQTNDYNSYLLAFSAFTFIGMSLFAIDVYYILYCDKLLIYGLAFKISRGILFLGGFSSLIGFVIVYGR